MATGKMWMCGHGDLQILGENYGLRSKLGFV